MSDRYADLCTQVRDYYENAIAFFGMDDHQSDTAFRVMFELWVLHDEVEQAYRKLRAADLGLRYPIHLLTPDNLIADWLTWKSAEGE